MSRRVPAAPGAKRVDDALALGGALLAALALRVVLAARSSGLTMDSPLYVRMAEHWRQGAPAASPAHDGYSLLVAGASALIGGREWPGRAVSLLASLVLVALVYAIARRRGGPRGALVPALAVALHPLLAVFGVAVMTEASFLALAFAGIAALDAGRARAGGAWLGAAWWVRPEAVVIAPLAVLLARLTARARLLALGMALLVALPYAGVLRAEQGYWSLTPKTALVRAPDASAKAAEWRLEDRRAFPDSVGLAARLARDGAAMLRAYPAGLARQSRRVLEAWNAPLLLLSLAGLALGPGRGPWLAFLVLPLVYPLLAAPADLRFAQLVVPSLALAAAGAVRVAWRHGPAARALAAALLLAGGALLAAGPAARRAWSFDDGPMPALRGAGAWLAAHTADDAVIMDRKSYVAFFANRRHVQLPDESLDEILAYARDSGATHLVVEEYVVGTLRPQLAPLLDARALAREPRVRLVFALRPAPGDGVVVLEVVR